MKLEEMTIDVEQMRQFYTEELNKVVSRYNHIKQVLDQIGFPTMQIIEEKPISKEALINITKKLTKQRSASINENISKKKANVSAHKTLPVKSKKTKKKRTLWGKILLSRLEKIGKPLRVSELVNDIINFSKLPVSEHSKLKNSLTTIIYRLQKENKLSSYRFSGTKRPVYFGLHKWFLSNGNLKKPYANRLKEN